MDRADFVHESFLRRAIARDFPAGAAPSGSLEKSSAVSLFRAQCLSRALDRQARKMQRDGQGFYTIGSSGHEGMAAVAAAFRRDDMAFLHYRDAAYQIARADISGHDAVVRDLLLSFACSSEDPISGGRHKVLGSKPLFIPPQTSTIASHLPKAVGAAYSLGLARRHPPPRRVLADDGVVVCSFGDASANHSTAQGAFNAAEWAAYQSVPLPLVFVCEDNGIGISVKTPQGWIKAAFVNRPVMKYLACDGLDIYDTYRAANEAARYARGRRKPVFLHMRTVRLYGHAGADVPTAYLSQADVDEAEANDPLLHSVRLLHEAGALSIDESVKIYSEAMDEVAAVASALVDTPRLKTAADVMRSLIPAKRKPPARKRPSDHQRQAAFGKDLAAMSEPQVMSKLVSWALTDLMLEHEEVVLMGQDIGKKGGVYGATQRLLLRFGADRVIDTLLDEQSILGLGIGLAHNGFVAIPEIQFLAYLHNAEDQLRGEAATLSFFSNGQFTNPMVVRIAGLGYQKGFGGHFHNDNSFAVLRDVPGLILACPSDGAEAAMLLRECTRMAIDEQRLCVFLEPIALYGMRDFLDDGDGGWMCRYPAPDKRIDFLTVGVHGDGTDLAIVTYGNGCRLSRQAQNDLIESGTAVRVIDLRWLSPLPEEALKQALEGCANVLIVDESRRSGGLAEALMALLSEWGHSAFGRLTAVDSFIATGPAHAATLPSKDSILAAAKALLERS